MEDDSEVILYGCWASPFVYRVIWALKLKGIRYDYREEDLSSKSPSLLHYNPVHKMVPVLVHRGRPVAESAFILQYIEETWPDRCPLLPADPYARAVARFWLDFVERKVITPQLIFVSHVTASFNSKLSQNPIFYAFFRAFGEDRETAAKEVLEALKIVEGEAPAEEKFFGGGEIGMVDLSLGWLIQWFECMQELVGVKVLEAESLPRLHQWTMNFKQEPVINENLPDGGELMAHYKRVRERFTSPELLN